MLSQVSNFFKLIGTGMLRSTMAPFTTNKSEFNVKNARIQEIHSFTKSSILQSKLSPDVKNIMLQVLQDPNNSMTVSFGSINTKQCLFNE